MESIYDLDWIFKNWKNIGDEIPGEIIKTLAICLGVKAEVFKIAGAGLPFYLIARTTIEFAEPFLDKGDKEGWIEFSNQPKFHDN